MSKTRSVLRSFVLILFSVPPCSSRPQASGLFQPACHTPLHLSPSPQSQVSLSPDVQSGSSAEHSWSPNGPPCWPPSPSSLFVSRLCCRCLDFLTKLNFLLSSSCHVCILAPNLQPSHKKAKCSTHCSDVGDVSSCSGRHLTRAFKHLNI